MAFDPTKPNTSQTIGDVITATLANLTELKAIIDLHEADLTAHGLSNMETDVATAIAHISDMSAHGLTALRTRTTNLEGEVVASRGSAATMQDRLNVGLLPSGAVRLSGLNNKWLNNGDIPTYISTTSFSVPNDRTKVYLAGANLRFLISGSYAYAPVASSSFAGGITTVVLDPAYPILTSGVSTVEVALIAFDNNLAAAIATVQATQVLQGSDIDLLQLEPITGFVGGVLADGQVVTLQAAFRAFTVPSGATGSVSRCTVAPTSSAEFLIRKNGTAFGSFTFDSGATTATFSVASATNFAVGDVISITGPATHDATLSGLSVSIKGVLL
jgi:hypothetical protein